MNERKEVKTLLEKDRYHFEDLTQIMRILRSENGCPWDCEQTHASIRSCMIEEAYEAVEAIDTENATLLREELGDVLFQVIFHAQIEAERGTFDVEDVVHDICVKMIHRHPHVFSDSSVSAVEDALARWEQIKTEEKQRTTLSSRLRAIPPMLPALMRAQKIAKKAGLTEKAQVDDVRKELIASANAFAENTSSETLGAFLFSMATLASRLGLDAEKALSDATDAVILRAEASESK